MPRIEPRGPQSAAEAVDLSATSTEVLVAGVEAIDEIVAKATRLHPGLARLARFEDDLARRLWAEWKRVAPGAFAAGLKALPRDDKPITVGDLNRLDRALAREVRARFSPGASKVVADLGPRMYRLAREIGINRAAGDDRPLTYRGEGTTPILKARITSVEPVFGAVDEAALEGIESYGSIWAGDLYDEELSAAIRQSVRENMIEQGIGRREAGTMLQDNLRTAVGLNPTEIAPASFLVSPRKLASYFTGLAANTATVARVTGEINSFAEYGVTAYQITAIVDERTTEQCLVMNGKTFTVEEGARQAARTAKAYVAADSADELREILGRIHPWPNGTENSPANFAGWFESQAGFKPPAPGTDFTPAQRAAASRAGFALPPYHWRCRTTVDIAPGAELI